MKKIVLLLLLCWLALPGCSSKEQRVAVAPYDANCLRHLQLGRDFVGQGRYELAKEHYLMSLAASSDPEIRKVVTHELDSVDMMIKAQR